MLFSLSKKHSEWWFIERIYQTSGFYKFKTYAIIKKFICFNWLPISQNENSLLFQLITMNIYQNLLHQLIRKHWNLMSALKEPLQIDYNTACSFMEQVSVSIFCYFVKILLTHFIALFSFYTSWNTSENKRFPDVFKGHWKGIVPWNSLRVI